MNDTEGDKEDPDQVLRGSINFGNLLWIITPMVIFMIIPPLVEIIGNLSTGLLIIQTFVLFLFVPIGIIEIILLLFKDRNGKLVDIHLISVNVYYMVHITLSFFSETVWAEGYTIVFVILMVWSAGWILKNWRDSTLHRRLLVIIQAILFPLVIIYVNN